MMTMIEEQAGNLKEGGKKKERNDENVLLYTLDVLRSSSSSLRSLGKEK